MSNVTYLPHTVYRNSESQKMLNNLNFISKYFWKVYRYGPITAKNICKLNLIVLN
jgi:hypothetical protein